MSTDESTEPDSDASFILIRHPESRANHYLHNPNAYQKTVDELSQLINQEGDPDITETGKKQAKVTARHLVDKLLGMKNLSKMKIFYSRSGFKRTEAITNEFLAAWESSSDKQLEFLGDCHLEEYTSAKKPFIPKIGVRDKSPIDFIKRVHKDFMLNILKKYQDEPNSIFIFFGHSLYWSSVLSLIQQQILMPNLALETQLMNLIESEQQIKCAFHLPNCSLSILNYHRQSQIWRILGVGKNDHLDKEIQTGGHSVF